MSKQITPKKKTDTEIRNWLYDGLMIQIEQDLALQNTKETVQKISILTPQQVQKKLESYKNALEEFTKRWPAYIASKEKELLALGKKIQTRSEKFDKTALTNLENSISVFDI